MVFQFTSIYKNEGGVVQQLHLQIEKDGEVIRRKFYARRDQNNQYCWIRGKNQDKGPWTLFDGMETKTIPFKILGDPLQLCCPEDQKVLEPRLNFWKWEGFFDHPFFQDSDK